MYTHILLPTDGSERSSRSIQAGIQLAKVLNARVTGVFVTEPTYIPELDSTRGPRADSALLEVAQIAEKFGVSCTCISQMAGTPQEGIVNVAKEKCCDLIIMGTHGRSRVGKLLLGSAAASVLAECEIPVLLYR